MLLSGKALKVSIYVSEGDTHRGVSAYSAILDYLFFNGVSGATVFKGVAGFGAHHHIHASSVVEISNHLPLKIEFVETPEKVEALMEKLKELSGSGLIEIVETTIIKPTEKATKQS